MPGEVSYSKRMSFDNLTHNNCTKHSAAVSIKNGVLADGFLVDYDSSPKTRITQPSTADLFFDFSVTKEIFCD
jgi:hypothetical protein